MSESLENIQRSTSNIQHPMNGGFPAIGCWMLGVGCWMLLLFDGLLTKLEAEQ
jgi:hypothetical protein